jgi:hypothetical protein
MEKFASAFAACLLLTAEGSTVASARSTPLPAYACTGTTWATSGSGAFNGIGTESCDDGTPGEEGNALVSTQPVIKTIDCGPPQVRANIRSYAPDYCGQAQDACAVESAADLTTVAGITTEATLQQRPDRSWELAGVNCNARVATPQVTALAVREQIERLVPHPKVGIAPPGGVTLVNIQTLLWVDTPADRSLGTVSLLGHRVALRVHVDHVDWDFGDGSTDITDGPEPKYDPADDCHTVTCPGYWGHVYATTGAMSVSAAVTWTGQYRVDGRGWQDIAGTVAGPATTAQLTVREARGVLVPDPAVR